MELKKIVIIAVVLLLIIAIICFEKSLMGVKKLPQRNANKLQQDSFEEEFMNDGGDNVLEFNVKSLNTATFRVTSAAVTSANRGEYSERDLICRLLEIGIPSTIIFHDLYLPDNGGYTQIDLVVPTSVGIFVFEVKDYSGWIFGDANNSKWTQVLAYGREKHQFYNPIMQNEGHIKALRNTTEQLRSVPIYSIIVFYGTSELRSINNIPQNCWVVYPNQVAKLVKYIMTNANPVEFTDKWEIMRILRNAVNNGENEEIRAMQLQGARRASAGKYKSTYTY